MAPIEWAPHLESDFDFNNPSDARAFLENPELPYMRISGGFGGPQNPSPKLTPMTLDQISAMRSTIGGFLTDRCAKFIDRLISAQTGKNYDSRKQLLEDFDKVTKFGNNGTGGWFWGSDAGTGGRALGTIAGGNAEIRLATSASAFGALHELIHVIAAMGDMGLSEQVKKLGITVFAYGYPGNIAPYPTDKDNENLAYSKYWGQALINACLPTWVPPTKK